MNVVVLDNPSFGAVVESEGFAVVALQTNLLPVVIPTGEQGPPGAPGDGTPHFVQITLNPGFATNYPLAGTPIGGAVLLYLNGLLESNWHLSGNTLVIDADLLVGDEVSWFYLT